MGIDSRAARRGIHQLGLDLDRAATKLLQGVVETAEKSAKATPLFTDKSGLTRKSIHGGVELVSRRGLRGFVEAGGASRFLEAGTKPHRIPRRTVASGKVLRFSVAGTILYRRSVNHPGITSRPFMARAKQAAIDILPYAIDTFIDPVIKRYNRRRQVG